jgi:dCTP diphosphatase
MCGMNDQATTVGELRALMREFVAEREWGQFHLPKNLAMSVAIEAGELLEVFQWTTPDEAVREMKDDPVKRLAAAEEISDVLLYLLSLANAIDLDVAAAVEAKMVKNRKKYPAQIVRGKHSLCQPE